MRKLTHPAILLTALAALLALALFAIHQYRFRFVPQKADLLRYLPPGDSTIIYADVALIRASGYLSLFAATGDPEYKEFVSQTHFDFARDLDALASSDDGQNRVVLLMGRFDWSKIHGYALRNGATCTNDGCRTAAVAFSELQPNVLVYTRGGGAIVHPHPAGATPASPLWVRPAKSLLRMPNAIPMPWRLLAFSLQSAADVRLELNPGRDSRSVFDLRLQAHFENPATADTARNQLELQTKMLKLELTRERVKPNPADLSGLLASGAFVTTESDVTGDWAVSKSLLDTLR